MSETSKELPSNCSFIRQLETLNFRTLVVFNAPATSVSIDNFFKL